MSALIELSNVMATRRLALVETYEANLARLTDFELEADHLARCAARGQFAVVDHVWRRRFEDTYPGTIVPKLRAITEQAGALFIQCVHYPSGTLYLNSVRKYNHRTMLEVTVPRLKKTPNLVSGLLLLAKNEPWWEKPAGPMSFQTTARTWTFWFYEDEGREVFDGWQNLCETDPVFKVILGT